MPKLLVKYGCSCWNSQFWVWKVAAPLGPRFSPNWSSWKTCCLWCLFQHSFRFLEKKGIKKVNLGKKPYSVYCRDKIVFCHKTLLFSTCSLKWHLVYTISVVGSACLSIKSHHILNTRYYLTQTILWILDKESLAYLFGFSWHRLWVRDVVVCDGCEQLFFVFSVKRRLAHQHLIKKDSVGPPVHTLAVRLVVDNLKKDKPSL